MKSERYLWRVGAFVLAGLVLIGGLLLRFSKGFSFLTPTYELLLKTRNVSGIKEGASVLMAGVAVGSVGQLELTPDGRTVVLHLRIRKEYRIHADAEFVLEQAGFLGDQYVSIIPRENAAPVLVSGALVTCEEPFNLQEAARAAAGFLRSADGVVQKLSETVARLDRTLLSEDSLTNLTATLENTRQASASITRLSGQIEELISSNTPSVHKGMSNLVAFSDHLHTAGAELETVVRDNRVALSTTLSNLQSVSSRADRLLAHLESGNGPAGALLHDAQLRSQLSLTVSNLAVLSSNLARFGLLHKPRDAKSRPPPPARPTRIEIPGRPF